MKSIYLPRFIPPFIASVLTLINLNACSILVGQVKPVEEKSQDSKLIDISLIDSNWIKIKQELSAANAEDIPDAAWQSKKTAAVISINSACRQNNSEAGNEESDPRFITESLLSQWRNLKVKQEREIVVSGFNGIETTAIGFYMNQTRKFQTVAVKTPSCVYDLIFLSPVESFEQEVSVFQKFRDSLKLK